MKKFCLILIALLSVLIFCGCEKKVGDIKLGDAQSAIYLASDGTVEYGVSEIFDKDYYDIEDLNDIVKKEVEDFNKTASDDKGKGEIEHFGLKNDSARLVMKFNSVDGFVRYMTDYNRIDATIFYVGKIEDNKNIPLQGNFEKPDKSTIIDAEVVETMKDKSVLIVSDQYSVQVDGSVLYVSEGCSASDDGIVATAKKGKSYIVFKLNEAEKK